MFYDPQNVAQHGPQITARPGTKRHAAQCAARARFFAILEGNHLAHVARIEAKIQTLLASAVRDIPPAGHA